MVALSRINLNRIKSELEAKARAVRRVRLRGRRVSLTRIRLSDASISALKVALKSVPARKAKVVRFVSLDHILKCLDACHNHGIDCVTCLNLCLENTEIAH